MEHVVRKATKSYIIPIHYRTHYVSCADLSEARPMHGLYLHVYTAMAAGS